MVDFNVISAMPAKHMVKKKKRMNATQGKKRATRYYIFVGMLVVDYLLFFTA